MRIDFSLYNENSQHGVEDACGQHTLRAYFAVSNLERVCEAADVDVVGAVNEDDVNAAHAGQEWNNAAGHDLVFAEKAFIADIATRQTESYENDGEYGAPPAVEQRRVVADTGAALGR